MEKLDIEMQQKIDPLKIDQNFSYYQKNSKEHLYIRLVDPIKYLLCS